MHQRPLYFAVPRHSGAGLRRMATSCGLAGLLLALLLAPAAAASASAYDASIAAMPDADGPNDTATLAAAGEPDGSRLLDAVGEPAGREQTDASDGPCTRFTGLCGSYRLLAIASPAKDANELLATWTLPVDCTEARAAFAPVIGEPNSVAATFFGPPFSEPFGSVGGILNIKAREPNAPANGASRAYDLELKTSLFGEKLLLARDFYGEDLPDAFSVQHGDNLSYVLFGLEDELSGAEVQQLYADFARRHPSLTTLPCHRGFDRMGKGR